MKFFLWLAAFSLFLQSAWAEPGGLERDQHYTALFDRSEGWLGADGAYSVPLGDGRTLWLFSDTLVGHKGQPDSITMLHNSLALEQSGNLAFDARQLFTPPDGKGWFWVYQGYTVKPDECWVFLGQFKQAPGPAGFDFAFVGSWLAHLSVPTKGLPRVLEYQPLPHWPTFAGGKADIHFGTASLVKDGYLYIYGTADRGGYDKQLLVARAPLQDWRSVAGWSFYAGNQTWSKECAQARPLVPTVSNELSLFRDDQEYTLVTQVVDDILLYRAENPWGPFLPAGKLGHVEEKEPGVITYNAKAHPHLRDAQGRWLITYNRNAPPLERVKADPSIYRPQFFRLLRR